MTSILDPHGGPGSLPVSIVLDCEIAQALDTACGATLSSRAALVRRALVAHLRAEGYLPALPDGRRHKALARPGAR